MIDSEKIFLHISGTLREVRILLAVRPIKSVKEDCMYKFRVRKRLKKAVL